jgi:general stress protein CsbA
MRVFKQLFDFYINASIHVALAVYALSWVTLFEFEIPYDENVLYFIFYASITGYNFVKYFGVAKFHHRSLANWLKTIQIFSFFCFLLMCYYAWQLNQSTLLCIAVFGLITFFYAIPFLPKHFFVDQQQNLRSVSGLKIYLIALVWSGVTVFLPLINNGYPINWDVIITAIQRFIFVIVLMLPFEIRDLAFDSLKLSTVPQKIGVLATKLLGMVLLTVMFFMEFLKDETATLWIVVLAVVAVVTGWFVLCSKTERNKYYTAFWVEGVPILWLALLLLLG